MAKQKVKTWVETIYVDDMEGDIYDTIQKLRDITNKYEREAHTVDIISDGGDENTIASLNIYVCRMESDEEERMREDRLAQYKANQQIQEYQNYLKLKEKYGASEEKA